MKVLIVSDIHGNFECMKKVIQNDSSFDKLLISVQHIGFICILLFVCYLNRQNFQQKNCYFTASTAFLNPSAVRRMTFSDTQNVVRK